MTAVDVVDKSYGASVEKKTSSSILRESRFSSLERDNSKLVSPEKVLSLRKNSAEEPTSQPLSSLLPPSSCVDLELSTVTRSASRASRDHVASSSVAEKRFVSESVHEKRSNLVHESKSPSSCSLKTATSRMEFEKRAIVDNSANVKGQMMSIEQT